MPVQTAGILVFRRKPKLEVFLVHNGGPFFAKRDKGFWTIPKGKFEEGESAEEVARREFEEETGMSVPEGEWIDLGKVRQVNNKDVQAWAVEGDINPLRLHSNTFDLEWPPKSGKIQQFPEVDRGEWFNLTQGAVKINAGQGELLTRLAEKFGEAPPVIPEQVSLF